MNTIAAFFNNQNSDVGIEKDSNNPLTSSSRNRENNSDNDLNQPLKFNDSGTQNTEVRVLIGDDRPIA